MPCAKRGLTISLGGAYRYALGQGVRELRKKASGVVGQRGGQPTIGDGQRPGDVVVRIS